MAEPISDRPRNVVPRWRRYRAAAETGTLHEAGKETAYVLPVPEMEIEALKAAWRRNSSPLAALEFIDTCVVAGVPERAIEAAQSLAAYPEPRIRSVVQYVLLPETHLSEPPELSRADRQRRIATFRRRLRFMPNNPILWVDLAREYVSLGQAKPAEKALRIARGLAPDNRFVLRASSRYHLHQGEFELAYDVLRRSRRTSVDPWLLAAELAAARLAAKTSHHMKLATNIVQSRSFSPLDISELASALATQEMATDRRAARRLFRRALEEPTENSVAQAAWAAQRIDFEVSEAQLAVPRAYEARAWAAFRSGNYGDAFHLSRHWLLDEPFATRPADFGAWIATNALDDYLSAIAIAEAAHEANPDDVSLCLHLAFSLACENRLHQAEKMLDHIQHLIRHPTPEVDPARVGIFIHADRGLIAFRKNDPALGRRFYQEAILLAYERKTMELITGALIYWGREELRIGSPLASTLLEKAKHGLQHMNEISRPIFAEKTDRLLREANDRLRS